LDENCTPPSGGEKREYHAPKAHFSGTSLSITAWDAKSNTCASLGFEAYANGSMQLISTPEHWRYRGGHLTYMQDAENCNPTGAFNGGYDQPRTLAQLLHPLAQEYYWVPRFMTIEGSGVTVGGACG
jgi:hypothetical protein